MIKQFKMMVRFRSNCAFNSQGWMKMRVITGETLSKLKIQEYHFIMTLERQEPEELCPLFCDFILCT